MPAIGRYYKVHNFTFLVQTESATESDDIVFFGLFATACSNSSDINIKWRFSDWGYYIFPCTPRNFSLKLTKAPRDVLAVNKIWQITATPEELKIRCNGIQVLHFIYNDSSNDNCVTATKGKEVGYVKFWEKDTATKKFISELVGK